MSGTRKDGILLTDDVGGGSATDVNIVASIPLDVNAAIVSPNPLSVEIVEPIGPNVKADSVSVTLATDEDPIDIISYPAPDVIVTGTINGAGQEVSITVPEGYNSVIAILDFDSFDLSLSYLLGSLITDFVPIRGLRLATSTWEFGFINTSGGSFTDRIVIVFPAISGNLITIATSVYIFGSVDIELIASISQSYQNTLTDAELRASSLNVNTELPNATVLADNTVNPAVPGISSFGMVFNSATWDRMRGDSVNGVLVNLGTNNDVSTKIDLTPAAPTAASVGVASAQVVSANANRRGLVLVNTSTARISLGFGATAVLDSGQTMYPGGVFAMSEYDFDLGAVNAIASAAASNLAIQEYSA